MNRFFLVFILILATVSNVGAKNCKKGKPCGNSCISRDKVCGGRPSISSSSSSTTSNYSSRISSSGDDTSSNSSPPARSYSHSAKPQVTYECNGVTVTESEFKQCNSAQVGDRQHDKEFATEVGDVKRITNSTKTTTAVAAEMLDADIFQCSGKKQQEIKLYGIDAPEDGQPFYQEAKDMLKKFIHKKKITAKIYSQDSDETALAVVFANGKNINELMVKSGAAWVRRDLCEEAFSIIGLRAKKKLNLKEKAYGVILVEFRLGFGNRRRHLGIDDMHKASY